MGGVILMIMYYFIFAKTDSFILMNNRDYYGVDRKQGENNCGVFSCHFQGSVACGSMIFLKSILTIQFF